MGRLIMTRDSPHILVFFLLDHDSYKISGAASAMCAWVSNPDNQRQTHMITELHYWLFYAECTWVVGSLLTE